MKNIVIVLIIFLYSFNNSKKESDFVYQTTNGTVEIWSYAPLEVISAVSRQLKGAINIKENTFAFTFDNNSFEGFNSELQKEHFKENYLETAKYPRSVFVGKIIEKFDFTIEGTYEIRAKGKLTIHGIVQERIIKAKMEIKNEKIRIQSRFSILLPDHNIEIPKIVNQKIAEAIDVEIKAEFVKK